VSDGAPVTGAAAELRRAFDAAFAAAPREARGDAVSLLAIRVGSDPYALRVLEVAGLLQPKCIVQVPSRRAELLGLMGLRGAVVPVYSLARLLGRGAEAEEPRWAVLCGAEDRVAVAFGAFEGHVEVAAGELVTAAEGGAAREHVAHLANAGGALRPVLSLESILRAITGR
jgi:chemotaxis signal transduction protein